MRQFFCVMTIFLASFSRLQAFIPYVDTIIIEANTGWREDQFNWSISGPEGFPNVLSELTWKDIDIWQVGGKALFVACNHVALKLEGDYGWIYEGRVRDSDYAADDRELEFSRSMSDAGRGYVYDLSASLGYQYAWVDGSLLITPLVGYAYQSQHFHMFHGDQIINFDPNTFEPLPVGRFPGLNSTYRTRWYGPWIGIDLMWHMDPCFAVFAGYEYHWARYRGHGDWNLREDIPNGFNQQSRGWGHVATAGFTRRIFENWSLGFTAKYQFFWTKPGREKVDVLVPVFDEFDDFLGEVLIPVYQPFRRANWRSLSLSGTVAYIF